ncbi:MAG TPA: hypothetical protein VMY35_01465 [Phycisphaerae bacterium]|nr:hypothetical protein [Phycisphaerae bacterium]
MSRRRAESPERFLRQVLESLRRAISSRSALRGGLWASAGALAAMAAVLLADAAWGFSAPARLAAYLGVLAVGTLAVGAALAAAWVRRPSLFYVAHLVERRCPELKNALVTFLEFSSRPGEDPSLAVAVARRAARVLARRDPASLVPSEPLRRPAVAVGSAAAVLAVGLWLSQGILFQPWVETAGAQLASAGAPSAPLAATADPAAENPRPRAGAADASPAAADQQARAETGTGPGSAQSEGTPAAGVADAASEALAEEIAAQAETFERLASALEAPTAPLSSDSTASAPGGQGTGGGSADAGGHDGGIGAQAGQESSASGGAQQAAADRGAAAGAESRRAGTQAESPGTEAPGQADGEAGEGADAEAGTGEVSADDSTAAGNPGTGGGGTGSPGRTEPAGPMLPPRPQPTELPENPLDATRWADHLIREADRKARDGEVTDAFLEKMGMSQADFRRFVVAWQRRLEAAGGAATTETPGSATTAAAETGGELVRATGAAQGHAILDGGPDAGPAGVVQNDPARVAARFRPVVSAYFAEVERLAGRRQGNEP